MKNREIIKAWERVAPDEAAERRMLEGIMARARQEGGRRQKGRLDGTKEGIMENQHTERGGARRRPHGILAPLLVAAVVVAFSATAFGAWMLMKPGDVAKELAGDRLSAAFDDEASETAVSLGESAASGDYVFSLLALVSGRDLTDRPYYRDGEISPDRSYAVVAVRKADGSPMGAGVGDGPFFMSPLVKGLPPWQVNAATLGGGYSESVVDGILYRLVECDDVSVFADRGLYFAICAEAFISNGVFSFDEETGEIAVNPDYGGASAVFDLPMDKSLADPAKAAEYISRLALQPQEEGEGGQPEGESRLEPQLEAQGESASRGIYVRDGSKWFRSYVVKSDESQRGQEEDDGFPHVWID